MDCGFVMPMLESGAVVIAPPETTRYNAGKQTFEFFRAGLGGKTGWYTPVWDNNALKAAGVTSRFLSEIIGWEFRSTETIGAVAGEFMGGGLFQSKRSAPVKTQAQKTGVEAVFDRKAGTLTMKDCATNESLTLNGVFSGMGSCQNDPACEANKGIGPIPAGRYLIGNAYNRHPKKKGDYTWYRLFGEDGKNGYSYTYIEVRDSNGEVVVRNGFNLHTGAGSAGCVTVPSDTSPWNPFTTYPQSKDFDRLKRLLNKAKPYVYKGGKYRGILTVK